MTTRAIRFLQTLFSASVNIGEELLHIDFRRFVHEEPYRRNSPETPNFGGDSLPTFRLGKCTNNEIFFLLFRG